MAALRTESVERAASILNVFSAEKTSFSLAELAKETGLHKSTILRLTTSLGLHGFIDRNDDGIFTLGANIWRLGLIFQQSHFHRDDIQPMLSELVGFTGETAVFYVKSGNERVCLFRKNSPNMLRFHLEEGMRLPLNLSASGMVLKRYSGEMMTDLSVFNKHGTTVAVGIRNPHIVSIATPVFSASGSLLGALAVSGLQTRFSKKLRNKTIPLLEKLSAQLAS